MIMTTTTYGIMIHECHDLREYQDSPVVFRRFPFQLRTLKRTFEQFDSDKSGSISVETLNTILKMMGMHVSSRALDVRCTLH